jgi:hypothetical protein
MQLPAFLPCISSLCSSHSPFLFSSRFMEAKSVISCAWARWWEAHVWMVYPTSSVHSTL